jgi:hypothetical protein
MIFRESATVAWNLLGFAEPWSAGFPWMQRHIEGVEDGLPHFALWSIAGSEWAEEDSRRDSTRDCLELSARVRLNKDRPDMSTLAHKSKYKNSPLPTFNRAELFEFDMELMVVAGKSGVGEWGDRMVQRLGEMTGARAGHEWKVGPVSFRTEPVPLVP